MLKSILNGIATVLVLPGLLSFQVRASLIGRDRALQGSSQVWSLIPGLLGQYLRRAFYRRALPKFGRGAVIEFGAVLSKAGSVVEDHAYIGPYCQLGLVTVGEGALLAAGAQVPSGPLTHGLERTDIPIRDQEGEVRRVQIGAGAWVGAGAVVLADVGAGAVVAAGAVVTERVPDMAIVGGVPARILKTRDRDRNEG